MSPDSMKPRFNDKTLVRRTLAALAVVLVVLSGATAFAQDDADETEVPLDEKLDRYWSVEQDLPAIKDKMYTREGKISVGVFTGLMSSQPFFWYMPTGARVDYYFNDHFGLEIEGSYTGADGVLRHNTELTDFLENDDKSSFDRDRHTGDRFQWRAHMLASWHPLYGKLALLQRKLAHFDFSLQAGLGAVSLERPDEFRQDSVTTIEPEFVYGANVHFFINQAVELRLSGRGYIYRGALSQAGADETFFQRLSFPMEFLAGVNFMF